MITTALGSSLRTPGKAEVDVGEVVILQRPRNPRQPTSVTMRDDMDDEGCITFSPGVFSQERATRMMLVGATIPSVTQGSWAGHWRTWLRCAERDRWIEIDSMIGNRNIDFDARCMDVLEQQATVYMFKRVGDVREARSAAGEARPGDEAVIQAALRLLALNLPPIGADAGAVEQAADQARGAPHQRAPRADEQVHISRGRQRNDE